MADELFFVRLPYATAGVIVRDDRIIAAAPILQWAVGKTFKFFRSWVAKKMGIITTTIESPAAGDHAAPHGCGLNG